MSAPPVPPRPGLGLIRLAVFNPKYLDCFGAGRESFLASLAPLVALPIVAGALTCLGGKVTEGVSFALSSICSVLAPPVIADLFCTLWNRGPQWARFSTVMNWAHWLFIGQTILMLGFAEAVAQSGMEFFGTIILIGFVAYLFAINLFIARTALAISMGRAIVLILVTGIGTAVLTLGPNFSALEKAAEKAAQDAAKPTLSAPANGSGS
jgi:hypothetical protein